MPQDAREGLTQAVTLARDRRVPLYLVGGAVRDLLLRRAVEDVDVVVEGDALAFAQRLARRLHASIRVHPRFATATLALPGGGRLDVAAARSEAYDAPAALPQVRPGGIEEDLRRRDFTVNSIAIRLSPGAPRVADPFGGGADLAGRVLRMLHAGSPRDDPTRAFRAARYANRLGFRIAPASRRWIAAALAEGAFESLSGDRLRREIALILSEPNRAGAVSLLTHLGLGTALHPALSKGLSSARGRLARLERLAVASAGDATWFAYLLAWAGDLTSKECGELATRLNLPRREAEALRRWPDTRADDRLTKGASADELLAASALSRRAPRPHPVRDIGIRGRDLLAAGIPPGPAIGRALAATREAVRLGRLDSLDELSFAIETARREPA